MDGRSEGGRPSFDWKFLQLWRWRPILKPRSVGKTDSGGEDYESDLFCAVFHDSASTSAKWPALNPASPSAVCPGSCARAFLLPSPRGRDDKEELTINPDTMMPHPLEGWGFDQEFQQAWQQGDLSGRPARITADYGEFFAVVSVDAEGVVCRHRAVPSGRLRHDTAERSQWPQVGDFAAIDDNPDPARIVQLMPRRTALIRKNAGLAYEGQVMAANIDRVLIMASMAEAPKVGRLERALALAWDSGADPVIILTKKDLADEPEFVLAEVEDIAMGIPVIPLSVVAADGVDALQPYIGYGQTVALLGPSGVGKSTLINYWLGEARQTVQTIRDEDGRGRHTTTHREMFRLPSGALVVDIPGIREIGLWDGGIESVFSDIDEVAESCRFADCQHADEPGCAVKEAMLSGRLDADRWDQYEKMRRELAHVERKRSAKARQEERQLWKRRTREARQNVRMKRGNH